MTIVPQDPQLFEDTLKNNLDFNHVHQDSAIEAELKNFGLWEKFEKDGGVEYKIEQNGSNLSQGEKQLVCLIRALLNQNKLILLDEATANIDVQTEQLIQTAIKTKFHGSTILMIAHRLDTINECDYILVLDKGTKQEFGERTKLEKDENSVFGKMLKKSNILKEALG